MATGVVDRSPPTARMQQLPTRALTGNGVTGRGWARAEASSRRVIQRRRRRRGGVAPVFSPSPLRLAAACPLLLSTE